MLAASGFVFEGAGCVGIVLGGCWLRQECITRLLAASRLYNKGAGCIRIVLQVLASSRFDFEGAG